MPGLSQMQSEVVRRSPALASMMVGAKRMSRSSVTSRGNEWCRMRRWERYVESTSGWACGSLAAGAAETANG